MSFDHLVGLGEQRRRDRKAYRFRCAKIYRQKEVPWSLHREIARFLTAKDAVNVTGTAAE
jgi:hypothetical protein